MVIMRQLSEKYGIDLIRSIASVEMEQANIRERVWSEKMGCWGFFAFNPHEHDIFYIVGCAKVGDMFRPGKRLTWLYTTDDYSPSTCDIESEPYIILSINPANEDISSTISIKLLSSNPLLVRQMLIPQKIIFDIAWKILMTKK
jgi:hypothetical protein